MLHIIVRVFFFFSLIIFSIIGVMQLIKAIVLSFYKNDKTLLIIFPFSENDRDVEYTLRSSVAKVRWMGKSRPQKVICLDTGMSLEARKICEYISEEHNFVEIMKTEELISLLTNNKTNF